MVEITLSAILVASGFKPDANGRFSPSAARGDHWQVATMAKGMVKAAISALPSREEDFLAVTIEGDEGLENPGVFWEAIQETLAPGINSRIEKNPMRIACFAPGEADKRKNSRAATPWKDKDRSGW